MDKLTRLKDLIRGYHSVVVAFSGGVDSTLLAKVAGEVLGSKVLLVTASSSTYPAFERKAAEETARALGLKHRTIVSEELDIPQFADNPPERCYYCKRELFGKIAAIARAEGYETVCDGTNADDLSDYRPGRRALEELAVRSPLCEAGLTKDDIRNLSAQYGLPTATKGSFACLASRFPYGETITAEKLDRVGKAEGAIRELGFAQFRVRSHGDMARCEFAHDEMDGAWLKREKILAICKEAGFTYVSMDLQGYRTGAMNEGLDDNSKDRT